ncbi:MAG: family 43 glycosylhydrolase [Lachnospiraceae bacterium]|nr:family 43 glycosylhydrolase [Lachnospiraceae bacterium]
MIKGSNPIFKFDMPDPDVIRVDDTFYMISTSMHFFPGAEILRSYDLINWEHASFVYDRLDSTPAQCLEGDGYIYGKGMWAASLRFHEGTYYVVFVCNDTQKTYLYRASSIEGPWTKSNIEGFYHDCSLLFDEGRSYLVYGNTEIYLTELNEEMSGPKEGGLHRLIVSDKGNPNLGYEGSHLYKINGKYYLFLIHSKWNEWKRTEGCFVSDSLEGEFTGGEIFEDDLGFGNSGIAQGGIVEGPEGTWNAILFQDRGAIGRIPVLVPVEWKEENGRPVPVFEKALPEFSLESYREDHSYAPLFGSDDFRYDTAKMREADPVHYGCFGFKSFWQFNHEPDLNLVSTDPEKGRLIVKTDRTVGNIFHAKNIITQKMSFPECEAEVTIDASDLNDGDFAGLSAFQGDYALVGICKENGKLYARMSSYTNPSDDFWKLGDEPAQCKEKIEINGSVLKVSVRAHFGTSPAEPDYAQCYAYINGEKKKMGSDHKLRFRLDHFTGCRFGIFMMSEKIKGGRAAFSEFVYK